MTQTVPQAETLAEEVTAQIEASDFTVTDVAHELHIDPADLHMWLAGKAPFPWVRVLEVADLLGVPFEGLVRDA